MSEEKILLSRLVLIVVLAVSAGLTWWNETSQTTGRFEVVFLDVGQGDAVLITTPEGAQVLIDGGPTSAVVRALARHMPRFDTRLDMVVATHPDSDHVAGLVDVLERYEVGEVVMTEKEGESGAARAFALAAESEEALITMARRGQVWQLGASTTLEILYPETDPSELESNASSIVIKVTYDTTSFMLTGDAPKGIEEYLVLTYGEYLQSTVLKAGHHGSRTSTSELWLDEVSPAYVVISAGGDNRYGHPHVEVTDAVFNRGIQMLSTAEIGDIVFVSDGQRVWVE